MVPAGQQVFGEVGQRMSGIGAQWLCRSRGCDYREVELTCGSSLQGGNFLVATHAWVIPLGPNEKAAAQRFAVTWDGLVYPVVTVGKPANLKTDVETLIDVSEKATNFKPNTFGSNYRIQEFDDRCGLDPPGTMRAWTEEELVSTNSLLAIKTCLLMRLGETVLAERVRDAWMHRDGRVVGNDPYFVFTIEWTWALFDRAVGAHNRGDDTIVVNTAKTLVDFQRTVPGEAVRRQYNRPPAILLRDPPAVLMQDSQRRLKAGAVRRVLDVGLGKFPGRSQRIAALIRDLEDVVVCTKEEPSNGLSGLMSRRFDYLTAGLEEGFGHGNPLKSSPIVLALVHEGQAAVEPLLECLVNDHRLTRIVGESPASQEGTLGIRDFVGVDLAAYAALCGILRADGFGPLTIDGYYHRCRNETGNERSEAYDDPTLERRRAVAAEIRRRFQKIKGQCPEEGWRAALADPEVGRANWLRAAKAIVEPVIPPELADKDIDETDIPAADEPELPLAGEVLRGERNPSVTELLAQRSDEMARLEKSQQEWFGWPPVCDLTLCLGKWDTKATVPVAHRRIADLRAVVKATEGYRDQKLNCLATPIANLIEAGLQAGEDDSIVQDYIAWLHESRPRDISFSPTLIFMPLWRHPDNPKMASLARWLFLADDSPWHPLHKLKPLGTYELLTSPLVGVPAFRDLLKRELLNTSFIGRFTVSRDSLSIEALNNVGGEWSCYAPDVELPESGMSGSLRACDYYAIKISRLEGSPRYEMYWLEKRRDALRKDIARFLDQWGDCFRDRSRSFPSDYDQASTARFRLPRLAQPAMPADVAAGRAIFSLRDRPDRQVRIVPTKPYPSIARWKTLKQYPLREPNVMEWLNDKEAQDPKVWERLPKELFDREGLIWQAEEVLLDGTWRRYYGFVGNHIISKVPADEIELLDRFSPAHPNRM